MCKLQASADRAVIVVPQVVSHFPGRWRCFRDPVTRGIKAFWIKYSENVSKHLPTEHVLDYQEGARWVS